MKQWLLILIVVIGASGWPDDVVGSPNSESVVTGLLDGSPYNLVDPAIPRPVLLKFWATWCVACLKEMPAYLELHEDYGERVRFVAVNVAVSDPRDRVEATVDEYGLSMPVAYDESGNLWDRYGIVGTPAYVLLGSDGTVLHRVYGHADSLESVLDSAIAAQAINNVPAATRSNEHAAGSPPITAIDIDGNRVDLSAADGEVFVGYHFAVWCVSYVRESYPELSRSCRIFDQRIQKLRDAGLSGVRLVGFISAYSTDESSAAKYRDKRRIDEPLIFDNTGAYSASFGARDFPHITVIAQGGKTIYAGSQVPENIQQIIQDALSDIQ